jgi:hypothetical protein
VVAGIIGPPLFIAKVRENLEQNQRRVYEFPTFVFPRVTFDIFIRRKANPTNIRRFLGAVTLATQAIAELRSQKTFAGIAAQLIPDMPNKQRWQELPYEWKVEQLDPDPLVEFWKREVEAPNKKTTK